MLNFGETSVKVIKTKDIASMNSHILFVIFFIISIIKPLDLPNINRYIGMGLFFLIGVTFLYTILKKQAWIKLWQNYRWEIIAIVLFLLVNAISLLTNIHRFDGFTQLVFYGFSSFAVWMIFPMSWVIFQQTNHERYEWVGWGLVTFILLVALMQIHFPFESEIVTNFTVATDATDLKSRPLKKNGYDARPFTIRFDKNNIIYEKNECQKNELPFFLNVYPKNISDLKNKKKKFTSIHQSGKRIDVNKYTCSITQSLPNYPIEKIFTGQYIPKKGTVWHKTFIKKSNYGFVEKYPYHKVITSITRWHTIFAIIAAISILISVKKLFSQPGKLNERLFFISLCILSFYTGILCESRNYLLTLIIGLFALAFKTLRKHPYITVIIGFVFLLSVNLIIVNNKNVAQDYGKIFPYLSKLHNHQSISIGDIIPKYDNYSTSGRIALWERGLALWQENKWFGVGPGSYRLSKSGWWQQYNLHNYYLQVLIDSGIIGSIIILVLLLLLLKRSIKAKNAYVLLAVLASLLFDNYLDYSMGWVLFMSWFFVISSEKKFP